MNAAEYKDPSTPGRLGQVLADLGVTGTLREFSASTRTAAEAAAALGCEVGAIANSLIFSADGAPLLVLASGGHRVDTEFLAMHLGVSQLVALRAREVKEVSGFSIGGVPPVGHSQPLPAVIDVMLAEFCPIWASAGTSHSVFATTFAELRRISEAQTVAVAPT
ncbi:MAG: YbaK/EbsC family protein [Ferrimicrobium sp.]